MSEWVWYCGSGRLKHLALMRASSASRHYARVNAYLLALGLVALQLTRVGWRWVAASPTLEPTGSIQPATQGWIRMVGAPRSSLASMVEDGYVTLWWNPAQAVIASLTAALGGLLIIWLGLWLMRSGVVMAHKPAYRGERRMTAALHYGTAWILPMIVAAFVVGLRPMAYVGTMAQWRWCPGQRVFLIAAAVLAGFGVVMGWLWLIRLGATAPARTRGRVVSFFVIATPLIGALTVAAWWRGLDALHARLFEAMKLTF